MQAFFKTLKFQDGLDSRIVAPLNFDVTIMVFGDPSVTVLPLLCKIMSHRDIME